MQIQCPNCQKQLTIPEDKLPDKESFQALCPQCHQRITVKTKREKGTEGQPTNYIYEEAYSELPRALICEDDPARQEIIAAALEDLGYKPLIVTDIREAQSLITYGHFELIILNEETGRTSSTNPLLNMIQHLPMAIRRNIFFALIGKNYRTMDNLMAFAKSANLVINHDDLPNMRSILKRSLEDHQRFYRVFKECLREVGKL